MGNDRGNEKKSLMDISKNKYDFHYIGTYTR